MTQLNRMLAILLICVFSLPGNAAGRGKYSLDAWWPMHDGVRLDYCDASRVHCGMAVANQYCKMLGYANATKEIKGYQAGETKAIGHTANICKGLSCVGFEVIRCAKNFPVTPNTYHYRDYHFDIPLAKFYRLDWCYDGKTGCGKVAANAYCRQHGYNNATTFKQQDKLSWTEALQNRKLCMGKDCRGFSFINCFR